jgi:tetratricopeptide (TPR) repeat protein
MLAVAQSLAQLGPTVGGYRLSELEENRTNLPNSSCRSAAWPLMFPRCLEVPDTNFPLQVVAMRSPVYSLLVLLASALGLTALTGCQFTARGQNLDGVRQFQIGDYQGAATHFQQALKINPRNADAYYNLGALYHRYAEMQKNPQLFQQAETYYQQCLLIDPNHPDCRRGHAVLLAETNRTNEAYQAIRRWAEMSPTSAEPQVELARLYQESGDRQSAEVYLQQALQIDPNNARAWTAMGKLREDAGQYSEALANYQKAHQINPTQTGAYQRIADLQSRGVYASPILGPLPAGAPSGTRMVNAPGPMRRF